MTRFTHSLKAACCVVVAAAALIAPLAQAQSQGGNAQLQGLANMYAISDYALGANDSCDLFTLGDYRALSELRASLRTDLSRMLSADQMAGIANAEKGRAAWKGCLTRADKPQEWALIDNARLMAQALLAAPTRMKTDQRACAVDGEWMKLSPSEWSFAATAAVSAYADSPRKAEFEGIATEMAGMIDGQCARSGASAFLRPGFEEILHTEDISLLLQARLKTKTVNTAVGTTILNDPVSSHIGLWRSRRGGFLGSRHSAGLNVYRVLDRADKDVLFFHLSRPGTFEPRGRMFVSRRGGWTARLKSNVDALQLVLPGGRALPLTKQSGEGTTALGHAVFILPADGVKHLQTLPDDAEIAIAYRVGNGQWTSFLDIGREPPQQKQTMAAIRDGLAWANAPLPAKGDRR